jgi:hypothetical protein
LPASGRRPAKYCIYFRSLKSSEIASKDARNYMISRFRLFCVLCIASTQSLERSLLNTKGTRYLSRKSISSSSSHPISPHHIFNRASDSLFSFGLFFGITYIFLELLSHPSHLIPQATQNSKSRPSNLKLNTVLTYPEMPSLSTLLVLSTLFLSGALSLPVAQLEFGVGGLAGVPLVETIPVDKKREAKPTDGLAEDKKRQADIIGELYFPYGLTEDKKRAAAPEHEARNSLENIEKL